MSMPLDLLLDECLEEIRQGVSLETILAVHPQEASTLRPLLETAAALHGISPQRLAATAFQKGQEHMLAVVEQEFPVQPISELVLPRFIQQILVWITGKEIIEMKLVLRFAIAAACVLAIMVSLGATAVSASNALPGDFLYPLKASAQNAQLTFTRDPQAHQALEDRFQQEYRNDVRVLMENGRQMPVRFRGSLDAMSPALWLVGGLPVSIESTTAILGNPKVGDEILVEATVQKGGSILASRITLNGAVQPPEAEQTALPPNPASTATPEFLQKEPEETKDVSPTEIHEPEDTEDASEKDIHESDENEQEDGAAPQATIMPGHPDDVEENDDQGEDSKHAPAFHPTEQNHQDDEHDGNHDGNHGGDDEGGDD